MLQCYSECTIIESEDSFFGNSTEKKAIKPDTKSVGYSDSVLPLSRHPDFVPLEKINMPEYFCSAKSANFYVSSTSSVWEQRQENFLPTSFMVIEEERKA